MNEDLLQETGVRKVVVTDDVIASDAGHQHLGRTMGAHV